MYRSVVRPDINYVTSRLVHFFDKFEYLLQTTFILGIQLVILTEGFTTSNLIMFIMTVYVLGLKLVWKIAIATLNKNKGRGRGRVVEAYVLWVQYRKSDQNCDSDTDFCERFSFGLL